MTYNFNEKKEEIILSVDTIKSTSEYSALLSKIFSYEDENKIEFLKVGENFYIVKQLFTKIVILK